MRTIRFFRACVIYFSDIVTPMRAFGPLVWPAGVSMAQVRKYTLEMVKIIQTPDNQWAHGN
jgi:hypothetical protein